ncbi:psbP-like protein 1, chloroplastic isoform X2 [Musa acuminata AAA Group]|uniref:psbP-like protein 1, chloroplastic isoform X2 n=1 Tax=Musa acuminata AAA Group TaxID=214697 RepID=UPI0031D36A82
MASLPQVPAARRAPFLNSSSFTSSHKFLSQGPALFPCCYSRRRPAFQVKAEASPISQQEGSGRRQSLVLGAITFFGSLSHSNSASSEAKKGFQAVLDKKDGYTFLYPFGWQEVVVQGQDKVFKDVIEPLESVSVNMVATGKQDVRDLGPPQQVAEALVKKVLSPTSQKTKLVEAAERDVDGKVYYTFEFIAQAPNYTRHALGAISIGNGKFYTLTTGANERRWGKMKDKLHEVVDSFKIFDV